MKIIYTSKFEREYKKLSAQLKELTEKRVKIFRKNPFDSKLKTHKLHGKFKEFLAFSIDYKYRIVFEISKNNKLVYFHSISDHDIYE